MQDGQRPGTAAKTSLTLGGVMMLLGAFAGLCTVFALVATAADAWREHAQESWPVATATLHRCTVDRYKSMHNEVTWRIICNVNYFAQGDETAARVTSHSAFARADVQAMTDWVNEHQPGSSIKVRYDPANHKKAMALPTELPYSGSRTPNNLVLLLGFFLGCMVLLTAGKVLRGSSAERPPGAVGIGGGDGR
jgi:hypothetical protein